MPSSPGVVSCVEDRENNSYRRGPLIRSRAGLRVAGKSQAVLEYVYSMVLYCGTHEGSWVLWTRQYAQPRFDCEVCQGRVETSEAVAMTLHPRLPGQHSAFAQIRGAEDLVPLIASFATDSSLVTSASCRAWAENLREAFPG